MKKNKGRLDLTELVEEIENLKQENSHLKYTAAEQVLDITALKQRRRFLKNTEIKKS